MARYTVPLFFNCDKIAIFVQAGSCRDARKGNTPHIRI